MKSSVLPTKEELPQNEAIPSPPDQLLIIESLVNLALDVGETRYLLNMRWYKDWQHYVRLSSDTPPGPIDNTLLFKDSSFTTLKKLLRVDIDVVPVPEEAWDKLVQWYGSLTPGIPRPVIEGSAQDAVIEVYPWEVSLVRILPPSSTNLSKEIPKIQLSKGSTITELRAKVIDKLKIKGEMKLWKFDEDKLGIAFITSDQLKKNDRLIVADLDHKTIREFGLYLYDTVGVEVQVDGKWPTQYTTTQYTTQSSGHYSSSKLFTSAPSSSRSVTTYVKAKQPNGVTGLSNLGNTCFMNSALQCLSNTPDLKKYFLSSKYKQELNSTNPLGMRGEVAKAFGELIERLWSGAYNSVTPRDFKRTIDRFAPSFVGYQQHDSQEFIAFLLDGLHEDLNRIYDKPYTEKRDSDGRPDPIVAEEHWNIHKLRNDSVVVDLFQGQYKSTLVCPECAKISVTFDPFMYLTLPVPTSTVLKLQVYFVPLDSKQPLTLNLTMSRESTHQALKERLGSMLHVQPKNLVSCEIYSSRIYRVFSNSETIDESGVGGDTDDVGNVIYVYELPVSFPLSPNSGHVILPVLNRYSKEAFTLTLTSHNRPNFFGFPLIMALPEAQISETGLRNAVLEQLSRYTTVDLNSSELTRFSSELDDLTDSVEISHFEPDHENNEENTRTDGNPSSTELFKMKITHHPSHLGIPENFVLNSSISLSKRSQKLDGADSSRTTLFLEHGDTIICEWRREVAEYVFNGLKENAHGFQDAFVKYRDSPIIEATEKKQITLYDCLNEFVKEEQLGEEDPWYCPNCQKHQQALKKFDLWRLPDILVVHLKRFSNTRSWRNKINALVDFPIRGLDLSPHVLSEHIEANGLIYDLYAISNHFGGLSGGHYTAYGYNHEQKRWYHFDDSVVDPVNENSIKTTAAYLLFYKRRDTNSNLPEAS